MSEESNTINLFIEKLKTEHYSSAFIKVLIEVIEISTRIQSKLTQEKTFQELNQFIKNEIEIIISACKKNTKILPLKNPICLEPVASYFKLIVKKALKKYGSKIQSFKIGLIEISKDFLQIIENSTNKIIEISQQFFRPNIKILVYSYSRSIVSSILEANKKYKDLKVYVCQTSPYKQGLKTYKQLNDNGVWCKVINDNQIGCYLEQIDIVIVGAEIVLENGSILNRIGTYTLAICSSAMKKPLYVFAQSYKFYRKFILSSSDIPQNIIQVQSDNELFLKQSNTIDFTAANYINLLCTDLGIFTTAAISDGLIKIFKQK